MTSLLGAYLTGAGVGLIAGVLLVLALWDRSLHDQPTTPAQGPVGDVTERLPRIHHLDDARRATRRERTR